MTKDSLVNPADPPANDPPANDPPKDSGPTPVPEYAAWKEGLDVELRDDPSLAGIQSFESLARAHVNAQKMIGAKRTVIPAKPMAEDPEGWKELFTALGAPEEADGYQLRAPEGAQEVGEDEQKWFKETALSIGLTKDQAAALYSKYIGELEPALIEASDREFAEVKTRAQEALDAAWGTDSAKNLEVTRAFVEQTTDKDFRTWLDTTGVGNDPNFIRWMHGLAKKFGDDVKATQTSGTPAGVDGGSATAKLAFQDLQADATHMEAYLNPHNPGHRAAVDKHNRAFEKAYGG